MRNVKWALWVAFFTAYSLQLFAVAPKRLPPGFREAWGVARRWCFLTIKSGIVGLGVEKPSLELLRGTFFVVTAGVVPWIVLLAARRGAPREFGLRRPNRVGWRAVIGACVLALPFLYWMVQSPGFRDRYATWIERAGMPSILAYYFAVLFVEHLLFHGVLLAVFRRDLRWPSAAPLVADATGRLKRIAQWIGLAQPGGGATGVKRLTRWIGLPDGCLFAVVLSGVLFAAAHLGKNPRELLLSLPGGMALAYVAYRTNTWLVPFVIHAATASIAAVLMFLAA